MEAKNWSEDDLNEE